MLVPIGLGTALSLMGDATLYAVLPTHSADAGILLASVGIVLSINRVIRLGTNGPAGWLFDRMRNRGALFVGSLWLGVISTGIYALVSDLPLLLMGRLLWGLAWSGIWVGGNALVLELAPEGQTGRWVGIYQTWFFLGSTLGSFLGGVLTDAIGYRSGLWVSAGIMAVGALISFAVLEESKTEHPRAIQGRNLLGWRWRGISSGLRAAAAANGINRLVTAGVVTSTLGLILQANLGTGLESSPWQFPAGSFPIGIASLTGGLLAARTTVSLLGAPLAGFWSDASGKRWELLAASLLLGGVGISLMAVEDGRVLAIGLLMGAAASGSIQSLATALVGDLSDKREHGRNMGLFHTVGDLGSAVGPVAAYALLPLIGLPAIYIGSAGLMIIVAGWTVVAGRRQPLPARPQAPV